jgi:spore coat protein A
VTHALRIDTNLHGAEAGTPAVRTVVHVHGLKVLPGSDGYPDAWFTTDFAQTGPFFKNRIYDYPNDQRAATLWYHDHAIGITRLNLYMGLAGLYILRDDIEESLNLPSGMYEIPLIIQDRNIAPDGSLVYPAPTVPPIAEFFGESILVNGKIWPYLDVEPRKYRFRMLNASNARFYRLSLLESDEVGNVTGHGGPSFVQIGSDGGLLSQPVLRASIDASPGERFDVIVDFSDHAGNTFVLANDAPAPFPEGGDVVPPHVMMFRVARNLRSLDTSSLPDSLPAVTRPDMADVVRTRDLVLRELESESRSVDTTFMSLINQARWDDPITETPRAGSTEIWRIINRTDDAHPMHVHLVQFPDSRPTTVRRRSSLTDVHRPRRPAARPRTVRPEGHRAVPSQRGRQAADQIRSPDGHPRQARRSIQIYPSLPHPRARGERDDAALRGGWRNRPYGLSRPRSPLASPS